MQIRKVTTQKKTYLDLLLLADEQEDMIDKYLDRGDMFVLEDEGIQGECVVTQEGDNTYEIKNIAVRPNCQKKGYGKAMIDALFQIYPDCETLLVGTGEAPSTLGFYHACGFTDAYRVKNFFTDHYDHIIIDEGIQLIDMVYLKRSRTPPNPSKMKKTR